MTELSQKSVESLLKEKEIDFHFQKETGQLAFAIKIDEREYPVFLRIFDGNELLQMLAFIPTNIKQGATNDTARLLHLLNKEVDLPGFGMEEENKVIFYRLMLPAIDGKLDPKLFDLYLNTIQVICKTFSGVIFAIANKAATFEEVLRRAKTGQKG